MSLIFVRKGHPSFGDIEVKENCRDISAQIPPSSLTADPSTSQPLLVCPILRSSHYSQYNFPQQCCVLCGWTSAPQGLTIQGNFQRMITLKVTIAWSLKELHRFKMWLDRAFSRKHLNIFWKCLGAFPSTMDLSLKSPFPFLDFS